MSPPAASRMILSRRSDKDFVLVVDLIMTSAVAATEYTTGIEHSLSHSCYRCRHLAPTVMLKPIMHGIPFAAFDAGLGESTYQPLTTQAPTFLCSLKRANPYTRPPPSNGLRSSTLQLPLTIRSSPLSAVSHPVRRPFERCLLPPFSNLELSFRRFSKIETD